MAQSLNEDYRLAGETFLQISHLTPNRPEIYLDLGLAYERWGDLERATASYRTAIEVDPESTVGFLRLAIVRVKKDDFFLRANALGDADFLRANAALDSADAAYRTYGGLERTEILYQRSALFKRLNRLREARNYGEQALQLAVASGDSVQSIRCYFLLACIFYAEGNKEGVEYERQAVSLAETTHHEELVPRGLIEIGKTFQSNRKLSEARIRFQTARAKARSGNLIYSTKRALYALGELLLKENPGEAISLSKEAGRIEFPKHFSPEILSKFIGKT